MRRFERLFGCLLLLALGLLYCDWMKPDVVGFLYDDGIYWMLAQSLMHGHGYRLMGIIGQPWFYKYPLLYPLWLAAFAWPINALFPHPLMVLKLGNILLSLAALGLLFRFYRKVQGFSFWVACGLMAIFGTHWHWMEVSTELMSEPLFLMLSVAAVCWAYEGAQQKRLYLPVLILLSVAAAYTRSLGMVFIGAMALWLWLKTVQSSSPLPNSPSAGGREFEKKFSDSNYCHQLGYEAPSPQRGEGWEGGLISACIYLFSCLLLLSPWLFWTFFQPKQGNIITVGPFLIRSFQETYAQSLMMDIKYQGGLLTFYWNDLKVLVENLSVRFFPWLEHCLTSSGHSGAVGYSSHLIANLLLWGISLLIASFLSLKGLKSLQARRFSLVGLYCGLYLLCLPLWSFTDAYSRLIIVILPFLYGFLVQGILQQNRFSSQFRSAFVGSFLAIGIISNGVQLLPFLNKPNPNTLFYNPTPTLTLSHQGGRDSQPSLMKRNTIKGHDLWQDYQQIFIILKTTSPQNVRIYTDNQDDSYFDALNTERLFSDSFIFLPPKQLARLCPVIQRNCLLSVYQQSAEVLNQFLQQNHIDYVILNRVHIRRNTDNSGHLTFKLLSPLALLIQKYPSRFLEMAQSADGCILLYKYKNNQ